MHCPMSGTCRSTSASRWTSTSRRPPPPKDMRTGRVSIPRRLSSRGGRAGARPFPEADYRGSLDLRARAGGDDLEGECLARRWRILGGEPVEEDEVQVVFARGEALERDRVPEVD